MVRRYQYIRSKKYLIVPEAKISACEIGQVKRPTGQINEPR